MNRESVLNWRIKQPHSQQPWPLSGIQWTFCPFYLTFTAQPQLCRPIRLTFKSLSLYVSIQIRAVIAPIERGECALFRHFLERLELNFRLWNKTHWQWQDHQNRIIAKPWSKPLSTPVFNAAGLSLPYWIYLNISVSPAAAGSQKCCESKKYLLLKVSTENCGTQYLNCIDSYFCFHDYDMH